MSTQRQIDYCEWTLRRLRNAETQLYQYQDNDIFRDPEKYPLRKSGTNIPRSFTQLQRRVDSTRRAIHRALQTLEKLKAAPDPAPPGEPDPLALEPPSLLPSPQTTSPQIGFVPAPPSPPHASRRPHPRAPVPPVSVSTGYAQMVRMASTSTVPHFHVAHPPEGAWAP